MKRFAILIYLILIALTFMQAGASLFAITVNISSLISEPPASLITAQGPYAFNPDIFWEKYPPLVFITIILSIVLNWKTYLKKWIVLGGLTWILSGVVAIVLLEPAQTEFLTAEFTDTISPELKDVGLLWRNYSLLFMSLSALAGCIYLFGLIGLMDTNILKRKKERS